MILEKTHVTLFGVSGLSSKQQHTLNLLYSPLMEDIGFKLYHLLLSLNDVVLTLDYKLIADFLNCSLDELEIARLDCEKFCLIQTYASNTAHQIKINAPKSVSEFSAHPLLGRLSLVELGAERIKLINSIIRENTIPENLFEEISQPIHVQHIEKYDKETETVYQNEIHELSNNHFDMKVFLANSSEVTFPKALHTKKNLEFIAKLANTYQLSVLKMRIEVAKALDPKGTHLDLDKLEKNVSQQLIPITSTDPNPLNWTTGEFLQYRLGDVAISPSIIDAVDYVRQKYNWSDSVLNVIVDYVIANRKAILTRNMLDQISSSLKFKNVKTQQQAINHFAFENSFKKTRKLSRPVIKKEVKTKTTQRSEEIDQQIEDMEDRLKVWK